MVTLYVVLDRSGGCQDVGGWGCTGVEGNQQGTTGLIEQQAGRWLAGLVLPVTQKMDGVSQLYQI